MHIHTNKSDAKLSSNSRHRKDTQSSSAGGVTSHFCFQGRGKGPITHMGPPDNLPAPDKCTASISPPHCLVYFRGSAHPRWPTPPFLPLRNTAGLAWGVGRGSQQISWPEIRVLSVSSQSEKRLFSPEGAAGLSAQAEAAPSPPVPAGNLPTLSFTLLCWFPHLHCLIDFYSFFKTHH